MATAIVGAVAVAGSDGHHKKRRPWLSLDEIQRSGPAMAIAGSHPKEYILYVISDNDDVQFILLEDRVISQVYVSIVERRLDGHVMADDIQNQYNGNHQPILMLTS
ncbi:hypothetical protein ACOSQ4_000939 [Xanthoceras sorbifolium]